MADYTAEFRSSMKERRREYMREYMRQYRLKKKGKVAVEENVWANEQDQSRLPAHTEVA
jgi:hypothetical protein